MKRARTREEMEAALNSAAEDVAVLKAEVYDLVPISPADISKDTEEDYAYARDKVKLMIEKSETAITAMMALVMEVEHPRAFEVLMDMLRHTSDMAMKLLAVQNARKKLHNLDSPENIPAGGNTTNNLFVGTTAELLDNLSNRNNG